MKYIQGTKEFKDMSKIVVSVVYNTNISPFVFVEASYFGPNQKSKSRIQIDNRNEVFERTMKGNPVIIKVGNKKFTGIYKRMDKWNIPHCHEVIIPAVDYIGERLCTKTIMYHLKELDYINHL